jgi:hypothetical protein
MFWLFFTRLGSSGRGLVVAHTAAAGWRRLDYGRLLPGGRRCAATLKPLGGDTLRQGFSGTEVPAEEKGRSSCYDEPV